jgi:hypothetical protein
VRIQLEQSDVSNVLMIPFDQKYVVRCFDSLVKLNNSY